MGDWSGVLEFGDTTEVVAINPYSAESSKVLPGLMVDNPAYIKVLTAENVNIVNDLIETTTFATGDPTDDYGFTAVNSLDATTFNSLDLTLGKLGDSGDENVVAVSETVGYAHTASLLAGTIGLGYFPTMQPDENYTSTAETPAFVEGKIWFHYANGVDEEPHYGLRSTDVIEYTNQREFVLNNPFTYGTDEAVGFQETFGADPTFAPDANGNIAYEALERSIDSMVETLVTSYAATSNAFPRNPPMQIRKQDISAMPAREAEEGTTTVGATSKRTMSTGEAFDPSEYY